MYEFACLPFGLSSAPRVFTKLIKPLVAQLLKQGIRLIIYLENILIMAETESVAKHYAQTTCNLLETLGFVINYQKSLLVPSKQMEFLGFLINFQTMTLAPPLGKNPKSYERVSTSPRGASGYSARIGQGSRSPYVYHSSCLSSPPPPPPPSTFSSLTGKQNQSSRFASNIRALDPTNYTGQRATGVVEGQLTSLERKGPSYRESILNYRDRCLQKRLGAFCIGTSTEGEWSQAESSLHINWLELLAGAFLIKTFTKRRVQMTVRPVKDNMSAAHYINKMGGAKSPVLSRLALDLWDWCLEHKIEVEAEYLPGILNTRADKDSTVMLDRHNWKIDPQVFSIINQLWGPLEVDLFASRLTNQLPRYYCWRPDPLAEASDAFSQD